MAVPKLRFKEFNNNWDEESFNEIFDFLSNNSLSRSDLNYEIGDMYNLHYGDILIKIENILNCEKYILPYINKNKQTERLNVSFLKENDIIFADTAEDYTAGKCCEIININEKKIASGLHTIPCRPKRSFALGYLGYYLNSNYYHKQLLPLITGTKVYGISKRSIIDTYIRFPSLEEQEKISNLLNKLDQKIELQKKKIEALKLYKMCIMNELFSCDCFVEKNLCDLCVIEKGKQVNNEYLKESGKYYMLNGGITPSGYMNNYNTLPNTISISEGGNSCGFVNFNTQYFWSGGHCYTLKNVSINNNYLYHLLKYNQNSIMKLRVGTGLPNIQKKALECFKIKIHNNEKQKVISDILTTYDKKIKIEGKRLHQTILLKNSLLQMMFI